jgi:membrane protein DedA with SNARE-associated domain
MDLELVKITVVDFVRENRTWAPAVVAALAFGESVAFLSLLTPATVILLAIGVLVGAAGLDLWPVWLAAALGAAAGDVLSYEFGRRFKRTAYRVWPLSHHPRLIVRGERFFARFGSWGLFAGRFFGPARAVVPLVAGIFGMPFVLFLSVTFASAFVWAFVLLAPGAGLSQYLGW